MEYRSDATLLGLPIVHVAIGGPGPGPVRRGVAVGWIAVGDIAIGVALSCGGIAIGGLSLGGMSLGMLAFGGMAAGLLAVGGLAAGIVAMAGAAFGWYAAIGGLAIAHDHALGGVARARHAISSVSPGVSPFSAIPHPPFRWIDALTLVLLLAVLLMFALSIQSRRRGDT